MVIAGWVTDDFSAAVAEIAAAVLVDRPAAAQEIAQTAHIAVVDRFRTRAGDEPTVETTRSALYNWLRPGLALGFLAATHHSGGLQQRLAEQGRSACLEFLRQRAHAPRHRP